MVGDSHSITSFAGISESLRDQYSSIRLFAADG